MILEDYFDFHTENEIRLKGHRIGIEDVLYEHIYNELTPAELAARFPTLSMEQLYATLLYYLNHRDRMNAYLANWVEYGRKMRQQQASAPTPAIQRLREARVEQEAAAREFKTA